MWRGRYATDQLRSHYGDEKVHTREYGDWQDLPDAPFHYGRDRSAVPDGWTLHSAVH